MIKCSWRRWCPAMIAILNIQEKKKWDRRLLRIKKIVKPGFLSANRDDDYHTVEYNRGKKIPSLLFSFCPFCGVEFKKTKIPAKYKLEPKK